MVCMIFGVCYGKAGQDRICTITPGLAFTNIDFLISSIIIFGLVDGQAGMII